MQTAKENNKEKTVGQSEIEGVPKDDITVVQFFSFLSSSLSSDFF